jgi:glutaredoxin
MFPKSSNLNRPLAVLLGICLWSLASAQADEVQYFNHGIDFWHDSVPDPKAKPAGVSPPPSPSVLGKQTPTQDAAAGDQTKGGSLSGGAFPWHQYLDPKNKEFFKEGDYTPPEPFMEIVRNPTDANLKMWFDYISKKNELSSRLEARMQEYLAKNGPAIPAQEKERVATQLAHLPKTAPNAKRFRFRLYFDSHCPHCKRMLGTMADLQTRGYFVEARQVDKDTRDLAGIAIPVEQAQAAEMKEKEIQSVPVLLVGDLAKKVVYR